MKKDKMMELDKIVFEWWLNTEGVSLIDIVRHFSGESVVYVECAENFAKWLRDDKHKKEGEG